MATFIQGQRGAIGTPTDGRFVVRIPGARVGVVTLDADRRVAGSAFGEGEAAIDLGALPPGGRAVVVARGGSALALGGAGIEDVQFGFAGAAVRVGEVYDRGGWRFAAIGEAHPTAEALLAAIGAPGLAWPAGEAREAGAPGAGLASSPAAPHPAPALRPALRPGERLPVPGRVTVRLALTHPPGLRLQPMAIGLDADRRLAGDDWWVHGARRLAPAGAVAGPGPAGGRNAAAIARLDLPGGEPAFALDLDALPPAVKAVALAVAADAPGSAADLGGEVVLEADGAVVGRFPLPAGEAAPTLWLGELSWRRGWRFTALAQPVPATAAGLAARLGRPDLALTARPAPAAAPGTLARGRRAPLADLGLAGPLRVRLAVQPQGREAFDLYAVGLDAHGRLAATAHLLGPGRRGEAPFAIDGRTTGHEVAFALDPAAFPPGLRRVRLVVAGADGARTGRVAHGALALETAGAAIRFDFVGADLGDAPAAIVAELYDKGGWRVAAAPAPLAGGLGPLLADAGRPDLAARADGAAPPEHRLLAGLGDAAAIALRPDALGRPLTIAVRATMRRRGLFGGPPLALGCHWVLDDGTVGRTEAVGGRGDRPPYLVLAASGLALHRPDRLAYLLLYAAGPDFGATDLDAVLTDPHGGEVQLPYPPGPPGLRFAALLTLERDDDGLVLRRADAHFADLAAGAAALALPRPMS